MLDDLFQFEILNTGSFSLTISKIIYLLGLAIAFWITLYLIKRILNGYTKFDDGQRYTIYTIIKYFFYIFFISASLKLLGVDVTMLVAGSAALFVGIGLGLQSLFYDFISGIILMAEGTIKIGNVIQIGDKRVEILAIRFRTSVVKTRDEKEIIIPNSYLTKNEIINWSNQKNINRHSISIHVSEEEVERAMQIMQEIVKSHPKVLQRPEPYVRIEEFTNYSVVLRLLFWSEEVLTVGRMLGEIRLMVLKAFRAHQIVMPYPQQIINLKNEGTHFPEKQ